MDDLQTRIKQATFDARAARLARGPRGELLSCHQIEDLVGGCMSASTRLVTGPLVVPQWPRSSPLKRALWRRHLQTPTP